MNDRSAASPALRIRRSIFVALLAASCLSSVQAADSDGDGIDDALDKCRYLASADQADSDNDGVDDTCDNCTQFANPTQTDADHDGFGNACDGDFNNDNTTNFADLAYLKSVFFSSDALAELTGDTTVNFADLAALKSMFFKAPGPSALAGSGANQPPVVNAGADRSVAQAAGSSRSMPRSPTITAPRAMRSASPGHRSAAQPA